MIRGGTTAFEIDITGPVPAEYKSLHITFKQGSVVIDVPDVAFDGNTATLVLSQEQTMEFEPGYVDVQANFIRETGERMPSYVGKVKVEKQLLEEVLS